MKIEEAQMPMIENPSSMGHQPNSINVNYTYLNYINKKMRFRDSGERAL